MKMRARLMCWLRGHGWMWKRNIYGDEIIACGYKRSVWVCFHCGAYQWRNELHPEPKWESYKREHDGRS